MKTLIAACLLTISASASAKPLAYAKQYGGFCAGACPTTTLTIHDNGQVTVERQVNYPEAVTTKSQVATLSKKLLAVVKADIAKVTSVSLVDTNPEGPMCMDAPYSSYVVWKDGKEVEIGADRDCHQFVLETWEGSGLVQSLKSLTSLYHYSQTPVN